MTALTAFWPWLSVLALGAFHGLNPAMGWLFAVALGLQERRLRGGLQGPRALPPRPPAMGWLFAVALGLQERRLRAVMTALGPIALGHALAIGLAAVAVGTLGLV